MTFTLHVYDYIHTAGINETTLWAHRIENATDMAVPCTACIQWTKFTHTTVRFLSWEGDDGPGANLFEQEHKTEEGTHQLHNYAEPHLHIK